ncbi:MAG TPA: S8 family serine peptidase [Gemmatimonadaceae bacterium]
MSLRRPALLAAALALLAACNDQPTAPADGASPRTTGVASTATVGINVLLRSRPGPAELDQLGRYGTVFDVLPEIDGVIMRGKADQLPAIRSLPFVKMAEQDQQIRAVPPELQNVSDFTGGRSTWNLDAVNVTADTGFATRSVSYTGDGVFVGVLDSGLLPTWRDYFPEDRIATQYATTFIGGGAVGEGATPSPPDKWERDQNSHGTHVVSTIIGYDLRGTFVTGVAPKATIIPVKVLNQNGSGWWSAIAEGIVYVMRLKDGALAGHPMVVNMSLGGGSLSPFAKAAIDAAVNAGVIIVAAAGNAGTAGMDYPGAYAPVISAAAIGWDEQWTSPTWWYSLDVADPTDPGDFYIADFSGRAKSGQDLDVAAPGSWVVGPYQTNTGHLSYFYLSGTSMATPHVAGVVALLAEKDPALTAAQAESVLEGTALALPPGCRSVLAGPAGPVEQQCWGSDATGAGIVQADQALAAVP